MALPRLRRSPVGGPQGDHGGGDDGRDDGGGEDPGAQPVAAGRVVLGVQRKARPVEARAARPGPPGVDHGDLDGGQRRLHDRQRCGGADVRAGPGSPGTGPLGGAAAAGAVVDVPDELAAQGGGEQDLVVAGEPRDGGAVTGLDDGEGGPGPLHLAGRGGEQFPGGAGFEPEDGGDGTRGSWWRTASSSASRCSGVVPAASGQASWASSRRRASAAGDSECAGAVASAGSAGVSGAFGGGR
ncbi:hypothetical protein Sfulv_26470 [Streptomyces fulvorobeus]|uniref:Uncharacterized protein n=1 Tax=Streptomyces fulvorobeus TaxID=284028 RepID=A0A7J0C7W4_9ACTN|nr:hypothetical protein Sfulv_26470 [Streptomyces fulvorobeus]